MYCMHVPLFGSAVCGGGGTQKKDRGVLGVKEKEVGQGR